MIAAFLAWCIKAAGKVLKAPKRIILYLLPFLFHFLLPFCTIIFTFTAPAPDPKHSAPPCHLLLECRIPYQNELLLILPTEFCRKQLDIPAAKSLLDAWWFFCTFIFGIFTCENTLDACLQSQVQVDATWPSWPCSWRPINCNYAAPWGRAWERGRRNKQNVMETRLGWVRTR